MTGRPGPRSTRASCGREASQPRLWQGLSRWWACSGADGSSGSPFSPHSGRAHMVTRTRPVWALPRPRSFLGWIIGLVTVVAVLFPFSTGAPLAQKIATAVVNLAIGVAIGSLLNGVAARSIRPPRDAVAYPPEADDYPTREYPAEPREYPAGRRHRSGGGGYGPMGGDPDR